jgi:hypothetical protein
LGLFSVHYQTERLLLFTKKTNSFYIKLFRKINYLTIGIVTEAEIQIKIMMSAYLGIRVGGVWITLPRVYAI